MNELSIALEKDFACNPIAPQIFLNWLYAHGWRDVPTAREQTHALVRPDKDPLGIYDGSFDTVMLPMNLDNRYYTESVVRLIERVTSYHNLGLLEFLHELAPSPKQLTIFPNAIQ